jgi:hypothetical protein
VSSGSGTAAILNSLVAGNEAVSSGGGIYQEGKCVLVNTTVVNNRANNRGGIDAYYSSGTSTPYSYPAELYLYNSLVWGNTATSSGSNMYVYKASANTYADTFKVRSSLIENAGAAAYTGTGTTTLFTGTVLLGSRSYDLAFDTGLYGAGVATGQEGSIFAGYAGGNYKLKSGSTAQNKGDMDYYPAAGPAAFAAKHGLTLSQEAIDALTPRWNEDLAGNNRFAGTIDIGA